MTQRQVMKRWSMVGLAVLVICSLSVRLLERISVTAGWQELTGGGEFSLSLGGEQVVVRYGRRVSESPRWRSFCGCPSGTEGCCKMIIFRPSDSESTEPLLSFWGPCDVDYLDLMSSEMTKVWVEPPVPGRPQRFKTYDINNEYRYWDWNGETYISSPAGYW